MSAVKILFIAGYPRSGSTVLAQYLGETPGFHPVGELRRIWNMIRHDYRCGCGRPIRDCPFWKPVIERVFAGGRTVRGVTHLQDRVDHSARIPEVIAAQRTGRPGPAVKAYVELLRDLYRAIALESGARVIVDSSKDAPYAHLLGLFGGEPGVHFVHLVRDPRGVAHSSSQPTYDPGRQIYLNRAKPLRVTIEWLAVNGTISWLRRVRPYLPVRYEAFAADPARVARTILEFVDHGGSLPRITPESRVEFGQNHMVAGNPVRYRRGAVSIEVDERWRSGMNPIDRGLVTALAWPALKRYGFL